MRKHTLKEIILSVIVGTAIGIPISLYAIGAQKEKREEQITAYAPKEFEAEAVEFTTAAVEKAEIAPAQFKTVTSQEELLEEEYYDSLEMLAACVEAEAGNQGLDGKRLVADVILNRVDDEDFPDTIEGVITQKYQFASYWNGAMEQVSISDETFKACQMELESRSYPEVLYFTAEGYGKYGTPWKRVGDHYFCTK